MRIYTRLFGIFLIATVLAFTTCRDDGGGTTGLSAGDTETYTVDTLSFVMAYVPGGLTLPTGTSDNDTDTVANACWIGETEVTYELWYTVHTWAIANEYTFANPGIPGNDGTTGSETTSQEPVTTVNWRDSMVWCNALTEWYNAQKGTNYACVYYTDIGYTTPHRSSADGIYGSSVNPDSGGFDAPYVKTDATGFRLVSSNEYELAARYRGTDTTNVVTGTILDVDFSAMTTKWTKGDSASGDTQPYGATTPTVGNYAVYDDNSGSSTAIVKSKTTGYNALGLYDMSGNVWEWCFDSSGSDRLRRGGSWHDSAFFLTVGFGSDDSPPYSEGNIIGFRFARTQ